jgi:hypothetical protein
MSTAFELQIYQNGQWQFDSYFDDKDSVVSEAERMNGSGRYAGVRVLQESYKENSNSCEYVVIFSRLGKDNSGNSNWRDQYQGAKPPPRNAVGAEPERRPRPRQPAQPKKKTSLIPVIAICSVIVLIGVGAMVMLGGYGGTS